MPQVQIRKRRGVAVVTLTAPPPGEVGVREALAAVTRAGCRSAVLDLANVPPDLALVKPLMALRRRVCGKGGRLVLCGMSAETREWLRATWLLSLFEVCPNVAGALACLAE
jgi:hypothetical protein